MHRRQRRVDNRCQPLCAWRGAPEHSLTLTEDDSFCSAALHLAVCTGSRVCSESLICSCCAGFGGEDADVAVFRFTLGIPGFDDALIPRAVGALGAAALVANHVLGAGAPSAAQVRGRVPHAGVLLAAKVHRRLLRATPALQLLPLVAGVLVAGPPLASCVRRAALRAGLAGAQARAEALGALLAAVACATPALEARLRGGAPGRGTAAGDAPAAQLFATAPELTLAAKQVQDWTHWKCFAAQD